MTEKTKTSRRRARGVVTSDKMDQTVTVLVQRLVKDPRYGKHLRRKNTFMAHNAHNDAREGDQVEIEETRPLSRRKRWRVIRVLRRAPVLQEGGKPVEAAPGGVTSEIEPTA
jgi:small subunit ribosomal protein S17